MRNINFSLILLFLLFSLHSSFASSREIAISETLNKMEIVLSQEQSPSEDLSAQDVQQREYLEEELISNKNQFPRDAKKSNPRVQDDTDKVNFYISGGYNANHMHYKELSGGNTLDEDYGKLEGFYTAIGYKSPNYYEFFLGRPFIEGYFRRSSNMITYDGASSAGPLEFDDEHAKIFLYGIKLGAYRDFSSNQGNILGYLDMGKRIWYRGQNRIVQGVLDYSEKYWWTYLGFGAGLDYEFIPKLSSGIDFEIMFSNSSLAKMRADLYEGGTFKLKNVYGVELKLPIKYYFLKNISFDLTPYFTYWHIKESDPVLISGVYYVEPDSKTHIEGILAGLTYNF